MEYLKAVFTLNVANEDMEAAKDLLADLAAAAGFNNLGSHCLRDG